MTPTHVVLRSLDAGGKRVPGEMVDARTWRHVEYFVESRRLRPVMAAETGVLCACGRLWISTEQAAGHCIPVASSVETDPEMDPEPDPKPAPKPAMAGRGLTDKQRAYYARGK